MQVVAQRAHVVDPDHLPERLEHVEVGMRASLDAPLVPEQRSGERGRRGSLSHPGGTVQEIGVRRLVRERRLQQPLRRELLRH